MRKRHNTFRSLLAVSLLTIFTTSLFFGSTFAWFTDSSGVIVNTFTMGKLKAEVYALNYNTETGKYVASGAYEVKSNTMLQFKQALPSAELLFEPGATYALPVLFVKNFSEFPINYKLRILRPSTVPTGDTESFYDVLKFYAKVGNTLVDLSAFEGEINAAPTEAGVESDKITIYVHMDENAGNEYNMNNERRGQVMQVSGIRIQFYLYQREGAAAAGVGSTWYSAPGNAFRLIDTDPSNGSSVPGVNKAADSNTTGKIAPP